LSGFEFAVRNPAPKVSADETALLHAVWYADADIVRLREQGVI
jgi:hypothetical protein